MKDKRTSHLYIKGSHRIAVLSDIHIPFQDKEALTKALKITKKFDPDIIVLNGDIIDCISLSRFTKKSNERNFNDEIKAGRLFLYSLRKQFPKVKIIYRSGNHEQRIQKFLLTKASELSNLEELKLSYLLHFKQLDIKYLEEKDILDFNGLKVIHGHEVNGTLSIFPARGLQLSTQCPSICGHSHRSSFYISRNIERKIIQSWTSGCLSQLQPDFMINNYWVHGIVLIDTSGNNDYSVKVENF